MLKRTILLVLAAVLVSGGAAYADFTENFDSYPNPSVATGYGLDQLSGYVWTAKNSTGSLSDTRYGEPYHSYGHARQGRGTGHRGDERPITAATTYTTGVVSVESYMMLANPYGGSGENYAGTGFAHDDGYNKQLTANLSAQYTGDGVPVGQTIIEWRDNSFAGTPYRSVIIAGYSWGDWVGVRTSLDLDNSTISRSYSLDDGANWITGPNDGEAITAGISVSQIRIQGGASQVYNYVDDVVATWVPEPATLGVLFLGGLAALLRRRR